jgi:hypothetical protein
VEGGEDDEHVVVVDAREELGGGRAIGSAGCPAGPVSGSGRNGLRPENAEMGQNSWCRLALH